MKQLLDDKSCCIVLLTYMCNKSNDWGIAEGTVNTGNQPFVAIRSRDKKQYGRNKQDYIALLPRIEPTLHG